jgi:uncharacterized phiE125 gp8 family phage protein
MNRIIDIKITEATITEAVTRAEAKRHCVVDAAFTADDTLFDDLIKECRQSIENACNISIVDKTVVLTADWKCEKELPYGPVKTITEVKFRTGTATDGTAQYDTLTGDDFSTDGELSKLFASSRCGRHKITYTTGFTTVPADLKLAILNEIAYRYENRGDEAKAGISEGAQALCKPFISFSWY